MKDSIIRASSLPTEPDCGLRWAAQNFGRDLRDAGYTVRSLPRHIGAANGSAVHAAAAFTLSHKMKHDTMPSVSAADEIAVTSLHTQLAEQGETIWDDTTPNVNVGEIQVRRQVQSYRTEVVPHLAPIAVEAELRAEVESGFILVGHPDEFEKMDLGDLKTGKSFRNNAAQYGSYCLLVRSNRLGKARQLIEWYFPRRSIRKPQPKHEVHLYDGPSSERLALTTIKRVVSNVKRFRETVDINIFTANPQSYLCSDKYCPLWGTKTCSSWRPRG